MKGILLAGGHGTRLYPITTAVSKQLLPVYDKPTIYYPLSTMMLAGIKDVLIISTPRDLPRIEDLLGDGKNLGLNLSYKVQAEPKGIAQAFLIGEDFVGSDSVCLILGDNLFYGTDLGPRMKRAAKENKGATVFAYHVEDPERYGVVTIDKSGRATKIEEKPIAPQSNWAVTGIYFYDNSVINFAKSLNPSKRGELEITDLNNIYLEKQTLFVEKMGRGYAWLDTGTPESLLSASQFIETIENRQGVKIACLEEIAYSMGFIDLEELTKAAERAGDSQYGKYLKKIASQEIEI